MGGDAVEFVAPTILLQELERDLQAAGKRSVRECLRSKAIPCPQVNSLLKRRTSFSNDEVMQSYAAMTNDYLERIKNTRSDDHRSSLWHVSRCATIIRFLQLLLELKFETAGSENATPSTTLEEAQLNKLVLGLLRGLIAAVCDSLAHSTASLATTSSSDELFLQDITTRDDARRQVVVIYCMGSLLRMNHYVRIRPFLLSPLWKGLCDMTAKQTPPSELTLAAVKGLCDHIQDGLTPTLAAYQDIVRRQRQLQSTNSSDANDVFAAKILGFLLVRLGTFLSCGLSSSTPLAVDVLQLLCQLRGLGDAVTCSTENCKSEDSALLKALQQISIKAEKAFNCWFWSTGDNESTADNGLHLVHLLACCPAKPPWREDYGIDLAYTYGKTCLFVKVLEDVELRESFLTAEDLEAVLGICCELMVRSLPLCGDLASSLSTRSISAVTAAFIRCETKSPCAAANARPGRSSLHYLLVQWLRPQDNTLLPLTRELVLCVAHLYAVSLYRQEGAESVLPFLELVAKLFFDVRTELGLREMLGALLPRMLQSSEEGLRQSLESLLVGETKSLLQQLEAASLPRKRKRATKAQRLDVRDLNVVCWVLSSLGASFPVDECIDASDSSDARSPISRSRVALASFQSLSSDPTAQTESIKLFCKGWLSKQRKVDSILRHRLLFFGISAARQVFKTCSNHDHDLPATSLSDICRLLELCTDESMFNNSDRGGEGSLMHQLALEAIRTFSVVGQAMSQSTPQTHLQSIAKSFQRVLSHTDWSIRSYAMSSLVRFASTLPATHKSILPTCVPQSMQGLLQQRLQNSHSGSKQVVSALRSVCTHSLSKLVAQESCSGPLLRLPQSISFAKGSLIMQMPTQEGRSAVVVFPPGQQSLKDIRFMLGADLDEEEKPKILKLTCAVPASSGSVKLIAKES